jgi:hypothetical protein
MRSVSSLWGSELVVGRVWGWECGAGDGPVCGLSLWRCLVVWEVYKVGMRFSSVRLIGKVLYGGIKIARTWCNGCDVGKTAGSLCALCGVGSLTGLSSWGFVEWVNGQLYKKVGLTRDLFGRLLMIRVEWSEFQRPDREKVVQFA